MWTRLCAVMAVKNEFMCFVTIIHRPVVPTASLHIVIYLFTYTKTSNSLLNQMDALGDAKVSFLLFGLFSIIS